MATDSTNLPQGELNFDAGTDMAGSEQEFGAVQLAQVTADGGQPVQLPQGQRVILVPVQPGQTLTLPTDSAAGLLAKIGPEGNLAIVVDGRTIILQGYVNANDQSPVRIVTTDGEEIDVADVVAATDPALDIQTAAGPATGDTGDTAGNGIFVPFEPGQGPGLIGAEGVLGATALQYKLIDDERRLFTREEDTGPTDIEITFDLLGGIVNEDDLRGDAIIEREPDQFQAALVVKDGGNYGEGNDPFDTKDREDQNGTPDDTDGVDDNGAGVDDDREPLETVATVKVTFGDDVPGTLTVDDSELPEDLKSEGEDIIYEVLPPSGGQGNGIVAFVDNDKDGKFNEFIDRLVFDIKVQEDKSDSEFHVVFTLYDNIDNTAPDANKDGAADLLGANEQILALPVKLTAEDSDGSTLSTVMDLGVEDDIPFFGEVVIGEGIEIIHTDAGVTHDESPFPQWDADDQSVFDPSASGPAFQAGLKVLDAGFSLPYGDSVGALFGIAQKQVFASFGADQATQEHFKDADSTARNSIFGELEDQLNADGDGLNDGENERPFELFMIATGGGAGAVPTEYDNPDTPEVEVANLTIADQKTNATVTWNGVELSVFVRQIDAQTIVGYIIPEEGEEEPPQEAREAILVDNEGNGLEAVFVLTIDDEGKLTFVQYHQLNHDVDGPTFPDHDDSFQILGEDGTQIINVRVSDFDGDHATQPVDLVIQDDGPCFIKTWWGYDGDSTNPFNGTGLIDEDKLSPNGNNDFAPGDDKGGTHADGTIFFDFGVDKPGHLSVEGLTIKDSAGNVIATILSDGTFDGASNLRTADGRAIEIETDGPDGSGIVTWTAVVALGEDGAGTEVFKLTIDTAGGNIGDFDFDLYLPLEHPFTDPDLNNDDNPLSSFEDNLNFDFTVRATDVDGDWTDGHIKIKVDDDSPKATCDVDCVVEGTHGEGELNFASGNVVTGTSVFFADDANGLDGNDDHPGADQPYVISKLVHGADTYNLVDNGDGTFSVTKNGGNPLEAGESFDTTTGVLTIPTDQGGTFEMVLVSSSQDEVGDYKYTVPEFADHDHDKHAGPADAAESNGASFDTLTEWTNSFSAAGITLVPTNGALAIKDINVAGPNDYRGIGVSSGGEVEVDNVGPDEKLQLEFATPTDNAKLLLGALFDGNQFDNGFQEILLWQVYDSFDNLVASGQILGSDNGLVTLDVDTNGVDFDRLVLTPINNGAGDNGNNSDFLLINVETCCPKDKFVEEFGYTLQDADGDESTATLKIDVKDTQPTVPGQSSGGLEIIVDEDGLNQPGTIRDGIGDVQPGDADEGDAGPDDGKVSGSIPFTPGADPVTIELSVGNGGDTGLETVDGKNIFAAWDAEEHRLVGYIEGTDPSDAANQVFVMQITDEQTGAFTFTLLQPIEHPDVDGQENGDNENIPDPYFFIDVQIEDKDCDVAYTQVKVTIDDDMPVVDISASSAGTTQHDETAGRQTDSGDDDQNGNPPSLFNVLGAGTAIGWAHDGDSVVQINNARYGADGPGFATYSLVVAPGGVNSGVDTTDGKSVWLFEGPNGIIVGRAGSGAGGDTPDANGQIIFAISIDGDGELTVVQYDSLHHPDDPNNFDEDIGLDTTALQVKLTLTDADGDSASDTANIGNLVRFDDDGPKAKIYETGASVQHDETAGVQNPGSGADRDQTDPLPVEFSGIVGTLIGWAKSDDPVVGTGGTSFGADDEGATAVLSLEVSSNGVDSFIDDTATGQSIFLYQNGAIIEGRVGGPGGAVAFAVSINTDGTINVAQYRALEHPNTSDHDEDVSIRDSAIRVVLTVTDGDGDVDVEKVDIGSAIRFDDDGPTANLTQVSGAQIVLDESVGADAGDPNANDEAGNVAGDIGYAKVSGAALFTDTSVFGQDGPAGSNSKVFSLSLPGGNGSFSGLQDSETNANIRLYVVGNTIEGRPDVPGTDPVSFVISVNSTTGEVTVSQYRAVEHNDPNDPDESTSPEIMDLNKILLNLTVKDGDGDTSTDNIDLGKLIKFEDDGVIANDDVDALQTSDGGATFFAAGNVVSGANVTTPGVDDGGSDKVAFVSKVTNYLAASITPDSNGENIAGKYGTLRMESDGDYTYDFNEATWAGKVPSGSTEVFTYTFKDSDGDTDTATLTITMGEATVETSAEVNPGVGGCVPEDTYAPVALTATPGTGDKVTQIVLSNVPAGWDVKDDSNADFSIVGGTIVGTPTFAGGVITFNIANAVAGVPVTVTVQVKGAPDSDVNGTGLVVGATVVDGVVFASDTTPFDVIVDAVADGDDKGDDGDADALGVTIEVTDGGDANSSFQSGETGNVKVTASYDDFKNGSETHTLTVQAPTGFTFGALGVLPAGVVLDAGASDADTLVFKVDSKDGDGQNGIGDFELNIPVTYNGGVQGSESGNFTATVTTTETPTDSECKTDNNSDSATATDTVSLASPPDVRINVGLATEGHCIFEDTTANFKVTAATAGDAHLTTIVLTGLPAGWTYDFTGLDTDGAGTNVVVDTSQLGALGQVTITFDPAFGNDYEGGFTATPPADSDADFGTLTGEVNAANNIDPTLTNSTTDSQFFETDAVADGDDGDSDTLGVSLLLTDGVDANTSFQGGETGNLKVNAEFDDYQDGSELHTLTIDAPAGFSFDLGDLGTVPAGVVLNVGLSSTTKLVFDIDSSNPGGVGSFELNIPVEYDGSLPNGAGGDFIAQVKAVEQNSIATPGDGNEECTDGNNTATAAADEDTFIANVPTPNVTLADVGADYVCVPEDSAGVDIPVSATTNPGSQMTSIVISGLPTSIPGTILTAGLAVPPASSVDVDGTAGTITINFLPGATAYNGTFKFIPAADSDIDLGNLTATVTAANIVDPTVTATDDDTAYVRVDAIADGKDVGFGDDGDASKLSVSIDAVDSNDPDSTFATGEKGQLTLNATFDDFHDGSEVHQITITAPAGFQFTGVNSGLPTGVSIDAASTETNLILNVDSDDASGPLGVGSIANLQFEIQNVSAGTGVTADFSATATATEQNTTATNDDENKECDDANNTQSVTDTAPVTSQSDLIPIAYDDKVCGDEPAPRNVNVLLILDRSGSMADIVPNSGGLSRLQVLQAATANMLNTLAANGDVRVMVIGFTTSAAEGSNGQWMSVAEAIIAINALTPANLTNYEDALEEGAQAFNNDVGDRGDFATHDNLVFFMSDGVPTTGGTGDADGNHLTDANLEAWDNFLEDPANSIDQLTVVGIGSDIAANDDDLEDVADPDYPGDIDAKNPFGQVVIVEDANDLSDALGVAVATSKISGDVLDGSIENNDPDAPTPGVNNDPDFQGDGPAFVSYFQYDHPSLNGLDITITWDGVGGLVVGDVVGGTDVTLSGTKVSFDTEFGRMTFDMSTGKFDFLAGPVDGGDKNEHFTYKITDSDGDESNTASLDVCIQDKYVDLQPTAFDNHDALTESSLTGAVVVLNNFDGGATGGTVYGGGSQAGSELVLTTSGGGGADDYADVRTALIAEGLSGAALDALTGDNPDDTSAFVRPVTVAGPSVLRFEYDYNGNDDGQDVATYFVINSLNQVVASGVLGEGNNDVANGLVTVPLTSAGNYKVIFTVSDREDGSGSSTLEIDRIETQAATFNSVSGNVVTDPNDTPSGSSDPAGAIDTLGDGTNKVSSVQFGSTIVNVPTDGSNVSIAGANGILTINATGAYTYVSLPQTVVAAAVETDAFTYTLRDADGDTDTAILRLDTTGVGGTVTISDVTVDEGNVANIVVTLSEPAPAGGLTLNYTFSGGTATLGSDYNGAPGGATVTIPAGLTTANIVVNGKNDAFFDDNETYNVVISGAPAGWTIADNTGVVTINDTTTITAPVVSFAAQSPSGFLTSGETSNGSNPWTGSNSTTSANRDNVDLGAGDDVGNAQAGHDHVEGGDGNDTLNGGDGNDYLEGDANNDTLNGGNNDDWLQGGDGNDTLHGDAGNDLLEGGNNVDSLFGDAGSDELFGGDGADTLDGGADNDYLHGEADGDLDKLIGGGGDDWLDVDVSDLGAGRQLDGGTGNDVLDISGSDLTGSTGITGIEIISMEGAGNQDDVSLNAADVLAITGGGTLFIWGDGSGGADDDVALTGGGWSQVGDNQSSNGRTYDVFQNGSALVAVDTDVEVALS
jgi:VCBS repeat-containing protein